MFRVAPGAPRRLNKEGARQQENEWDGDETHLAYHSIELIDDRLGGASSRASVSSKYRLIVDLAPCQHPAGERAQSWRAIKTAQVACLPIERLKCSGSDHASTPGRRYRRA